MRLKAIILAFAALAFGGCEKPQPTPAKPDYAKVEFAFENIDYADDFEFHITELRIVNLIETTEYPNPPFHLGDIQYLVPQKIENATISFYPMQPFYTNLADFDSDGKVFVAIRLWVEHIPDNTITQNESYALYILPVEELEAGVHYKFIIRTNNMVDGTIVKIDKVQIVEW